MATDSPPQHPAPFRKGPAPASPAEPAKLRAALLAFGVFLGVCGLWLLLPELLRPKPVGLARDKTSAAAAGEHHARAVLAARIGAIRGDLWAEAAFADSSLFWLERGTALDHANAARVEQARSRLETALAYAPINGAAWLFLASLPGAQSKDAGASALENSYLTAPNDLSLADLRLERAAASGALADRDIQNSVRSEIRKILTYQPRRQTAIMTAYHNALPQNQSLFENSGRRR